MRADLTRSRALIANPMTGVVGLVFRVPSPVTDKTPGAASKEQTLMRYNVWLKTRGRPEGISALANTAAEPFIKIPAHSRAGKTAWALNDSGSELSEAELTRPSIGERR